MWPEIVCPVDKRPLRRSREFLSCSNGHSWSMRVDIPRLVLQEGNYADAFGLQWKVYRKTQLDSYTKTTISYDRARRCLGESWARLHAPQRADVLEVGCGAGRFTEVLLHTRSAHVTSVDYSSAVEANQANFPQNERHRVIQADVLCLPFGREQFDIVFGLGVVQHTPCPESTIAKLYEHVKPGGWLVLDHYTGSWSHLAKSALLIRPILKRLSPERGLKWSERFVDVFLPLHRAVRRRAIPRMLLSRISPVLAYYHAYPQLDDQLQYEWALLDTHDSLSDWYKHLRTRGEIAKALQSLGAVDVACEYAGNGVEARCRRPDN